MNNFEFLPPKTSTYSFNNLKGTGPSNSVAGAFDKKKPKSICIIRPDLCNKMLPLWRSLIYKK